MKLAASLIVVALGVTPVVLGAEENPAKIPQPIWRDAPPATGETELDRLNRAFVQIANHTRPAIAQIRVISQETKGSHSELQSSRGSGFFIDPHGYLLTAQHVIDKAKTVEVRLADSNRLPAQVVAADNQIDVAILKVKTEKEVPTLPLGDSEAIQVGDLGLVFGYPFGRESSMNLGIISRAGRTYPDSASFDFIQTDAGAYAGGSGGPLLNRQGHVIGMITMASERGNMGFATPINIIKRVLPRLVNGDKFAWGWLGVQMTDISLEQAKILGLHPVKGVVVSSVLPGQPAARSGLQKQDVILSVNDNHVESPRDVFRMVGGLEAGRVVRLTIIRKGQTMELSVPLGTRPESTKAREG
ncbi:MAG TPA: trypsin-like peptidase domain-containing protein [Acidobacteriota bacterium]|nr:trypsin-like peptidase domain-containing protein [Acidobacteriota bacterium]